MATGNKLALRFHGPWKGVNENVGEQEPGEFETAWNVEIDGATFRTRRGRKKVNVRRLSEVPLKFLVLRSWLEGDVTKFVRYDFTAAIEQQTGAPIGDVGVVEATDSIFIGFSHPVSKLNVVMKNPNINDDDSILQAYYSSPSGFQSMIIGVEGTNGFKQDGSIEFDVPDDWSEGEIPDLDGKGLPKSFKQRAFWIRIKVTNARLTTGTSILSLSADLPSNASMSALKGANGTFQWRTASGERIHLIGLDDRDNGIAKLYSYNRLDDTLTPIFIPQEFAKSGPDAFWQFSVQPEGLIACNGYTLVYAQASAPMVMRKFESVELVDYASQSNSPPVSGRFVEIYEDRIYVADGNTVKFSQPVGDTYGIAEFADAPLGGCNVFYPVSSLTVVDTHGGGITGMKNVGQYLAILTPRTTWIWDGISLRCADPAVGCVAPRSLCSTGSMLFFLGPGGPYIHADGRNVPIGSKIQPTVDSINTYAIRESVGEFYAKSRQYRLCVPTGYSQTNNECLVYHLDSKGWTFFGIPDFAEDVADGRWLAYSVSCMHSARDEECGEELFTIDYDGNIYVEDVGSMDDGSLIFTYVVHARVKGEDEGIIRVRNVRATVLEFGDMYAGVGVIKDGASHGKLVAPDPDPVPGAQTAKFKTLRPGSSLFGASYEMEPKWNERQFFQARIPFNVLCRTFRTYFWSGTPGTPSPICIKGWDVEVIPKTPRRGTP